MSVELTVPRPPALAAVGLVKDSAGETRRAGLPSLDLDALGVDESGESVAGGGPTMRANVQHASVSFET